MMSISVLYNIVGVGCSSGLVKGCYDLVGLLCICVVTLALKAPSLELHALKGLHSGGKSTNNDSACIVSLVGPIRVVPLFCVVIP